MPEPMSLIESIHVVNKRNHRSSFVDPVPTKYDNLKSLSFDVYSSKNTLQPRKPVRSFPPQEHVLPPIDHRLPRKLKRPYFRTSLYHPIKPNDNQINLPSLTARGTKSELLATIRNNQRVHNFDHHAPPPSPSDDQIERFFYELTRAKQMTSFSTTYNDGNVPYRLPALRQTPRQVHSELNYPPRHIKATMSNYFEPFYDKY